jgi:hypothetical protein
MTETNGAVRDFTDRTHTVRQFRIDDDVFQCAKAIPAGIAKKIGKIARSINTGDESNTDEQLDVVGELLDMILLPESAELFARRMLDPLKPISLNQVGDVLGWLMEEYGGRPTQPSDNSLAPPTPSGTSLTDGAQVAASTV